MTLESRVHGYWCLGVRMKLCRGSARLRARMELGAMLNLEHHPRLAATMRRRLGVCEVSGFVIEPSGGEAA